MNEIYNNIAAGSLNASNELYNIVEQIYSLKDQQLTKQEALELINSINNVRKLITEVNEDVIKNFYPNEIKEDYLQSTKNVISVINTQNTQFTNTLSNMIENENTSNYSNNELSGNIFR